jgi:peroxidase
MALDGDFLPSSRQVSLAIHRDSDRPHPHLMAFTAVWAEFIAKDMSHTPQMTGFNRSAIKCCGVAFDNFHPDCYPIRIDVEDPFYSKVGDNCQEYVRSSVAPRIGCTLGETKVV